MLSPLSIPISLACALGLAASTLAAAAEPSLLVSSTPGEGQAVPANPHWIRLYFRTDVYIYKLELRDAEGRRLPLRWGGPEDPTSAAEAFLPDDVPNGTYVVDWAVGDARGANEDVPVTEWKAPGAPQGGQLRFTIGKPG